MNKLQEVDDYINEEYEIIGIVLPNCNINGKYGLVQTTDKQLI